MSSGAGAARKLQLFTRSRQAGLAVSWADASGAAGGGSRQGLQQADTGGDSSALGFLLNHESANASIASEAGFAATGAQYSGDGTLLCCWGVVPVKGDGAGTDAGAGASEDGSKRKPKAKEEGRVFILDSETGALKCAIKPVAGESGDMRHIFGVEFSPRGDHLLVHERFVKNLPQGNVSVWRIAGTASGEPQCLQRFYERRFSKGEPALQWTGDEAAAGHLVKNQVQFYAYGGGGEEGGGAAGEGGAAETSFSMSGRVGIEGAAQMSVAPSSGRRGYHLASFKPDAKGKPGQVAVYRFNPKAKEERGKPVASLSFFNAQECVFRWSPDEHCRSLLVETRTDVDHTGASYYGESFLYLLQADGRLSCKVG